MKEELIDQRVISKLQTPETKKSLVIDDKRLILRSDDNKETFDIINQVYILLPKYENKGEDDDPFKYIEHYEIDAEISDYFNPFPLAWRIEFDRLHSTILKGMKLIEGKFVLDVGSGGGWLVDHVINKGKSSIVSMDLSSKNISKLVELFPNERYTGVVGDALNMPFKDGVFDYVVASEVIEHVPDPKLFLEHLYRVVKPGGKLIISTPYKEQIVYSVCVHCNKPTPHSAHLHSFNEKKLSDLFNENNVIKRFKFVNHWWLLKTRFHILFSFLPYFMWRKIDKFFIFLVKRPSRIILEIEKPN